MATHGIIGDDSYGTQLPQSQLDEEINQETLAAARFSKSKEFQLLKTHLEDRITFYQTYLPDGRSALANTEDVGQNWVIANAIIGEFKAVLDAYEQAAVYAKEKK